MKEIGSRTNLMKNAEGPFSASRSQIERSLYAKFLVGPFLVGFFLRGIDPVTRNRFQSNAKESVYRNEITASEKTLGPKPVYQVYCPYAETI